MCDVPLMVDIDTDSAPARQHRTHGQVLIKSARPRATSRIKSAKRRGHRPGKEIVTTEEMVDRVKAAADAKTDPTSDRPHGRYPCICDAAIERAIAWKPALTIFAEAAYDLPMHDASLTP